jgi:hypothetical protein
MKSKGKSSSRLPARNNHDQALRLAVATAALGMSLGVSPSDALAIPDQRELSAEPAASVATEPLRSDGQVKKQKIKPDSVAQKMERPATAYPKFERPEAGSVKRERPNAVFPKVERPNAVYPKVTRPRSGGKQAPE